MPFRSSAQMKAAFSGALGPEMKAHAQEWASATPNISQLPEHVEKKTKQGIIKKRLAVRGTYTGKGGPEVREINRNRTKGNDFIPKENEPRTLPSNYPDNSEVARKAIGLQPSQIWKATPPGNFPSPKTPVPVRFQVKPKIPYGGKDLATPGPADLSKIVVPSTRIPQQANPKAILPAPRRRPEPRYRDRLYPTNPKRTILKKNIINSINKY